MSRWPPRYNNGNSLKLWHKSYRTLILTSSSRYVISDRVYMLIDSSFREKNNPYIDLILLRVTTAHLSY
jgi:hypothetical protein